MSVLKVKKDGVWQNVDNMHIFSNDVLTDAEGVTFGMVYEEMPTGLYIYGDAERALPEIPKDVLATNPYVCVRKNNDTGNYDLLCATSVWYAVDSDTFNHNDSNPIVRYIIPQTFSAGETWTHYENTTSSAWGNETSRKIVWSNHNVPNGSATSTSIYLYGSEPELEMQITPTSLAKRKAKYAVTDDRLNAMAVEAQRIRNTTNLLSLVQVEETLKNSILQPFSSKASGSVAIIAEGFASSTWDISNITFTANASGLLPTVYKGTASVTWDISNIAFEPSAVGILTE